MAQNLTLIAITGIEDPLRLGVTDAVAKCHRAGVTVKMCTGDNVLTARSIAAQCGIFTSGGIIMEGPVFRKLSNSERLEIVPRLQVLARSSPEDKKILVETLKSIGEIVGVTGDGTNDGPALKTANVGFSMGIAGTEVAKEASDIILMDDNFKSIVQAIMWGRCVNDAVRKFLQFQISTNVTAVIITFVSAVSSVQEESVLSAVQLLWINIIMDTFAALALATDPASESLLDRKPDRKTAPLFSVDMYKMILMQSVYQVIIILVFHFRGLEFLHLESNPDGHKILKTLVFNAFVFAQIFNSVNCRRLDNKLNIFEGIIKNRYFIGITLLGTSRFCSPWIEQCLTQHRSFRGRHSGGDRFRWWCRLPGDPYRRTRMGNFSGSRLCVNPMGCYYSSYAQQALLQAVRLFRYVRQTRGSANCVART